MSTYSTIFLTSAVDVESWEVVKDANGVPTVDENGEEVTTLVTKSRPLSELYIMYADMYAVSLSILADIEDKIADPNPKNTAFVRGYRTLFSGISLEQAALRIVKLYDTYKDCDFAPEMFFSYRRWGRGRMQMVRDPKTGKNRKTFVSDTFDEKAGFDPYVFSKSQAKTSLSFATMTLLAKALRFFLEETLRHFFMKPDPESWFPYKNAKTGKNVIPESYYHGNKTSRSFNTAIDELLSIFNSVYNWSDHLDEFAEVSNVAVEAGRADKNAKNAARIANVAAGRKYGVAKPGDEKVPAKKEVDEKVPVKQREEQAPLIPRKPNVPKVVDMDTNGWATVVKRGARVQPVEETEQPVEDTAQPVEETVQPVEETVQPVEETEQQEVA